MQANASRLAQLRQRLNVIDHAVRKRRCGSVHSHSVAVHRLAGVGQAQTELIVMRHVHELDVKVVSRLQDKPRHVNTLPPAPRYTRCHSQTKATRTQ